jgi:hypothetical protein
MISANNPRPEPLQIHRAANCRAVAASKYMAALPNMPTSRLPTIRRSMSAPVIEIAGFVHDRFRESLGAGLRVAYIVGAGVDLLQGRE